VAAGGGVSVFFWLDPQPARNARQMAETNSLLRGMRQLLFKSGLE